MNVLVWTLPQAYGLRFAGDPAVAHVDVLGAAHQRNAGARADRDVLIARAVMERLIAEGGVVITELAHRKRLGAGDGVVGAVVSVERAAAGGGVVRAVKVAAERGRTEGAVAITAVQAVANAHVQTEERAGADGGVEIAADVVRERSVAYSDIGAAEGVALDTSDSPCARQPARAKGRDTFPTRVEVPG